jgi:ubiquinol-cytochrome c reductase cytochrome c1 subunit
MIRIFSILVGLFFSVALAWSFAKGAYTAATEPAQQTAEYAFHKHPKDVSFASDGVFGKFDAQQLQRGFQVYKEVCAACHSLRLVAFRDLKALGYNEDEVRAIAAQWAFKQPTFDVVTGDRGERDNLPADRFPVVYYAGQGTPPDLSLITKARHDGGAYTYSLLTGYTDQAGYKNEHGEELLAKFPEAKTGEGLYFNPYFPNLNLSMAPPLTGDGQVTYGPGNPPATVDQMAKDVSAFLIWTAEPNQDKRRQTGWPVLGFLLFATILGYLAYRNVWAETKH